MKVHALMRSGAVHALMRCGAVHAPLRCGATALALALALPAGAQSLDSLKGMLGGGHASGTESGAGTSALGALTSGNLASSSLGNATGVLQYCIKNNYLSGNNVTDLKDKLTSRITGSSGQPAEKNNDFLSGAQGLLKTGDGKSLDLNNSALKAQVTQKACDAILAQAKGML